MVPAAGPLGTSRASEERDRAGKGPEGRKDPPFRPGTVHEGLEYEKTAFKDGGEAEEREEPEEERPAGTKFELAEGDLTGRLGLSF